jgi:hypothetical protein
MAQFRLLISVGENGGGTLATIGSMNSLSLGCLKHLLGSAASLHSSSKVPQCQKQLPSSQYPEVSRFDF